MAKRTNDAAVVLAGFTLSELEAELDRRRAGAPVVATLWNAKKPTLSAGQGRQVAADCADGAYSFDAYFSWQDLGAKLAQCGLTAREIEAVLRSKWTRWAADEACGSGGEKYGHVRAGALVAWMGTQGGRGRHARPVTQHDLDRLVGETFGAEVR